MSDRDRRLGAIALAAALAAIALVTAPQVPSDLDAAARRAAELLLAGKTRELGSLAVLLQLPSAWLMRSGSGGGALSGAVAWSLIVGAAGFAALGLALRRWLVEARVDERRARAVVLTALCASPLVVYARVGDGTVWAALGLVLALSGVHAQRAARWTGGTVLLVLASPAHLLVGVFLLARALGEPRLRRPAALGTVSLALALAAWLDRASAGGPLSEGVYGALFSTGKSLIVYAPWLALAALGARAGRHRLDDEQLRLDVALLSLVALATLGWRADWHGDPAWGARPFVVLLPILALPLVWLRGRVARVWWPFGAGLGALLQLPGLLVSVGNYGRIVGEARVATGGAGWFGLVGSDVHFVPQLSPLVGHTWLLWHRLVGSVHLPPAPWKLIYQSPGQPPGQPPGPALGPSPLDGRWAQVGLDWWGMALGEPWRWLAVVGACAVVGVTLWGLQRPSRGE